MTLASQARRSHHRRHDSDDGRQTGVKDIDELKAFLASSDVLTFKGSSREETYAWIEHTLRSYKYRSRPRLREGGAETLHAQDNRNL